MTLINDIINIMFPENDFELFKLESFFLGLNTSLIFNSRGKKAHSTLNFPSVNNVCLNFPSINDACLDFSSINDVFFAMDDERELHRALERHVLSEKTMRENGFPLPRPFPYEGVS